MSGTPTEHRVTTGRRRGGSLVATLRPELPAEPAQWREATLVALAVTTALAVATVLQVPSFSAPIFALMSLQHTTVCTWRNLVPRAAIAIGAGVVFVPLGGLLVQLPWLLVPAFFVLLVLLIYGVPMARNPIESSLVAFPLIQALFSGTYDPEAIATDTRNLVCASLIGIGVATAFAQASSRVLPRARLAESLAATYARARDRLARTMRVYLAEEAAPPAGEAPVLSAFGGHVQLLDLVRQQGVPVATERLLVTLVTAAERAETHLGTIDTSSRQAVGRAYRRMIAPELAALAAALEDALAAFGAAAVRLASGEEPTRDPTGAGWPDLAALVEKLEARQLELRRARAVLGVDVAQGLNANAVVQALAGLADILHTAPWELHRIAGGEALESPPGWPRNLLPIDRFALRYALQVGVGGTIAFVLGIASHVPELSTLLWNPVLVAQSSYGATIRKAWLRLFGVVVGGVLAIATIAGVFANTNDFAVWLLVVFLVVAACQHAILRRPTYWYGPLQVAITYFFVLVGDRPLIDVGAALWRTFGTFAGTAILYSTFRLIAPDYAGRQLVVRLADLLRATLVYLPPRGAPLPGADRLLATRLAAGRFAADLLRLLDEARLEGPESGVDVGQAVQAVGIATRVSLRAGVVARARAAVPRPALDADGEAKLERLRLAVRARVAAALDVLDARQTNAPPGSRAFHEACTAAARRCAPERADPSGPLADALAYLEAARTRNLLEWPPDALDALLAELEHFRRVTELLPRLDAALERAILPVAHGEGDDAPAGALVPSAVTRP